MVFLDPTFGNNGKVLTSIIGRARSFGLTLDASGRIIVVGATRLNPGSFDPDDNFVVARYSPNGQLDSSFSSDGIVVEDFLSDNSANTSTDRTVDVAVDVAVDANGNIVLVGSTTSFGLNMAAARYDSNGNLDPSFGTNGKFIYFDDPSNPFNSISGQAISALLQGDKILLAGDSGNAFALLRLNANGSPDLSFGVGGDGLAANEFRNGTAFKVISLANGSLLAVGRAINSAGNQDFGLVRYDANGRLDTSFGNSGKVFTDFTGTSDEAYDAIVQADGKIVVVGSTSDNSNGRLWALARYNLDGSLDPSFGGDGRVTTDFGGNLDEAIAVVVQPNGKLLVVGGDGSFNPNTTVDIARYNPDGSLDTSFDGDGKLRADLPNGSFASGAVLQDGKLLISGTGVNGADTDLLLLRYVINQAPTDVTIDNTAIDENQPANTLIGTFSTADPDTGDTHTYELTSNTNDNAIFTIEGNQLKARVPLNFEAKQSYSIQVKSTDDYGDSIEKQLVITVNDLNDPTTDITEPDPNAIIGTDGDDILIGDSFDNIILGLAGNDRLIAGAGNDQANGGTGNDRIDGGAGNDVLIGGAGRDRFIFDIGSRFRRSVIGVDRITDFSKGDKIVLDRTTFTKLRGKSFASVRTAGQAGRSDELITYVRSTGRLYYNPNGERRGFGTGGLFADLQDGTALTAADLAIVR